MPHDGLTGIVFDSGGYRLLGRLFMAPGDDPKPTAILLHGLPGVEQNHDLAFALREHGWNAVIFHYRGCWGSGGLYTFRTLPDDTLACLDYLCGPARPHPQVDPDRVALIGLSMGGWTAILAAARDARPRAVCVIGAVGDPARLVFDDPVLAASEFTPWLPGHTVETFGAQWLELAGDAAFNPTEQVARLAPRPLLAIHAAGDAVVPVAHAEEVYARAAEPKQWLTHPEANHTFSWHRPWLRERIIDWLDRVAAGR